MKSFTNALVLAAGASLVVAGDRSDASKSAQEIVTDNGFLYEEHTVTTEDGYILQVWRIPGKSGEAPSAKPPVLMQHGILDSANCWLMNYAEVAPAFVAAEAGYDVWLGNTRGNTYSDANTDLDPNKDEKKFYDFSWDVMGRDVVAVQDYMLTQTGQEKIAYIGHSQGTTEMFYALAKDEQSYADKMSLFVALAPVTKISHNKDPLINFITTFYNEVADIASVLGIHQLLSRSWITSTACKVVCEPLPEFCELLSKFFVSNETDLDDDDRFAVYMGHEPNGASVKAMLHYAQNMREDRFQEFSDDYTDFFNRKEKRTTDLIPLESISEVPIAIFTGTQDPLADLTDSRWLRDTLSADVLVHYEEVAAGHLTFMVGKDMTYFTEGVMGLLNKYHPLPSTAQPEELLQ